MKSPNRRSNSPIRRTQSDNTAALIAGAKAAEADTDEKRWAARLKAVAKAVAPTPTKSVRKASKKTATR
jgi:hypothetical protein